MNSGRIYVTESQIICGSRDGTANVLYPHSSYTHPVTKQCNYSYTHPSTIQCNAASEINSLKSSVSNGKSAIASAITDKGISTAADATFQTMANNISNISSIGYGNFNLRLLEQNKVSYSNSPYTFSTTLNPDSLYLVTGGYFNVSGAGTGYYIALIYNNTKLPQGFNTVGQFYYDNLRVSNNKLLVTSEDNKAFDLIQVW